MKIKQDEMRVGELFKGIPDFVRVFQEIEREIKRYNCYRWNKNTTKEKLIYKYEELLSLAKNLQYKDLILLYCLRKVKGKNMFELLQRAIQMYEAHCDFYNALHGEEKYIDILRIGKFDYGDKK